ncbi:pyridoxal 5'-phosphate synthase glutaminase subunit PdxT [Candidatus Acetothermia bacterium]|nr:pyridoxal 5'-phosphate synthase glutaminase subunit PdxT [Candidatus Acetothermia bacterium]MBI3460101.1 pyridoxal 5'-phosphate synthase glutaminase subunit PdxT [Candidatus Acetothermia bacterium]
MKVGVLGLQGDFREHLQTLQSLEVEARDVRTIDQLNETQGLIIPGGESTTISLLMERTGLMDALQKKAREGFPVYGTCAGMILVAKEVTNYRKSYLSLIDISVRRNAYGRQVDSFEADLNIKSVGLFRAVFIRAPQIERVGAKVEILAEHNSLPVMARQKNILVSSFHPELTGDTRIHEYFINMIKKEA